MKSDKQLQNWIHSAPVVVFRSPITEMDALRREFSNHNIDFTEIELSMADSDSRDYFHQLKNLTRYPLLPQIFIDSTFIGGADKTLQSDAYSVLASDSNVVTPYKKGVLLLGYAGVIPFLIFTLLAFFSDFHSWAIEANLAYGAVILTFIGAIHWGLLLRDFSDKSTLLDQTTLIISILPSVIAWVVLIDYFSAVSSFCILISSFMSMCAFERYKKLYSSLWYRKMRMQLTYTVSTLLALSLFSILVAS